MTRTEIFEELTSIAKEVFVDKELILTDQTNASNVSNWTSLTFMQFLTEIENKFNVKFKMLEILKFHNIGAIVDTLQDRL